MLKLGKVGEFDVANPPPGVWGTFSEGVRIKVRKLTAEVISGVRKQYTRIDMEVDPKSRRMVPVEKVSDEKYDDAMTDYLIEDFAGLGDGEGIALPVTLESKKRILNYLPLKDFVWAFAQSMDTTEEQEKNS